MRRNNFPVFLTEFLCERVRLAEEKEGGGLQTDGYNGCRRMYQLV